MSSAVSRAAIQSAKLLILTFCRCYILLSLPVLLQRRMITPIVERFACEPTIAGFFWRVFELNEVEKRSEPVSIARFGES